MRAVFCDTSGFYAAANPSDKHHKAARKTWEALLGEDCRLVTSNYVMLESISLMQARSGLKLVREFCDVVEELVEIAWVDATIHDVALRELLSQDRRRLSFVDCSSFALMRRHHIATAFAFDAHFSGHGFIQASASV